MRKLLTSVVAVLLVSAAFAGGDSAEKLLADAGGKAKAQGKNVMVIFHASWCGWCKKLDEFMAIPEYKSIFDDNYVVVHMTVMESQQKKADETAGGMEFLTKMGGDKAGLPYFVVVDPGGKKLADSLMKPGDQGSNTGHPVKKEEVAHFMSMLKKTAKKMSSNQAATIQKYLSSQKID
ncbi:MAG: hypothetical protein HONBIEJF_00461 [Fimbriimonadaceae bacterium]|nr:hypothetical protein [Fimbriimonadaceae bacterium]